MYREIFVGVFAVLAMAAALPVQKDYPEEAMLQGALDEIDDWSAPPASHKPFGGGHTHKPRQNHRKRNNAAKPTPVHLFSKDEQVLHSNFVNFLGIQYYVFVLFRTLKMKQKWNFQIM